MGRGIMKKLSILAGKGVLWLGDKLNRGRSLPGQVSKKIDKDIMKKIKLPKHVIAVTGSCGKGSTSKMIAEVYKKLGYKVAHNYREGNLEYGVLTALIEYSNLNGEMDADVLVLEVDERYTKIVFPILKPEVVVITNISRDQPPRQGHFDLVLEAIKKALTKDMHLILNADDPYLQKLVLNENYKTTYYSLDKTIQSTKVSLSGNLNITHCPKCGKKLDYDYYHFEAIGKFKCSKCSFKNPKSLYNGSKVNYEKRELMINDKYKVIFPFDTLYCVYNTLAAFTTLAYMKLDLNEISEAISNISYKQKNFNTYTYKKRNVYVLNTKTENSSTFNHALMFLNRNKGLKTVVLGWNVISLRYKYNDLSWLYDIDFEILNKHEIDRIICIGINRYDLATRLKYSGIDPKKIFVYENLEKARGAITKRTKGDIYAIINFNYMNDFNKMLREDDDK